MLHRNYKNYYTVTQLTIIIKRSLQIAVVKKSQKTEYNPKPKTHL